MNELLVAIIGVLGSCVVALIANLGARQARRDQNRSVLFDEVQEERNHERDARRSAEADRDAERAARLQVEGVNEELRRLYREAAEKQDELLAVNREQARRIREQEGPTGS